MVKLFVEGGGDHNDALKTECRKAFAGLLTKAGFEGRLPRLVVCGGRARAFRRFCTALDEGERALLLVDGEGPVEPGTSPWQHVKQRAGDGWDKPEGATDDELHLMVQVMEAWFLADRAALRRFYGEQLQESALPAATASIEAVSKQDLFDRLKKATQLHPTKGAYGKGAHSFKLLATLDPALVRKASGWAERFFRALDAVTRSA